MKRHLLIALMVLLVCAALANEVVAYQEDFESGAVGWQMVDGSVSPNNWHIYNYGGTQGNVWWMGDPALASGTNIGGYDNHQYLVLDTPARTLTAANASLTFKMRLGLEDPGPSGGYDGWDSANIRISTNGGSSWTVITGSPAYHYQNSYAFGLEHGEGMGVPGWGGIVTNWTTATFNLSSYIGQSVKIRFAFASDPAYSTVDQPNMFGFMVDDISFGGYSNNGINDSQMSFSSMVPLGGQLWSLATDTTAPSPTHVMKNQNASGSYNPNMLNYLVSPSITLPANGEIRADFTIMGSFTDTGTFPDVDYFGWEISPDNGTTWNAMSNPYADPTGDNYVYTDTPAVWTSMVDSYTLTGIITNFAGQTVKFRWYFKSNATVSGTGIRIDDFKIYNDVFIATPENLSASVSGANVQLSWDAPGSGGGSGEEGWISYDGINSDSIGTGSVADFDVAVKWAAQGTVNSIYPYVGMNITQIKFWPNEVNCQYSVRIWTGSANTLVVDQPVTNPIIGAWNVVLLNTPFTIPAATSIMVGYRNNAQTGYPAGIDAGPTVDGFGNWINLGGWSTLSSLATIEGNWNIKAYVAATDGREYTMNELPQNDTFAIGSLHSTPGSRTDREVSNYKIYRDDLLIGQVSGTVTNCFDLSVSAGLHAYHVTAMYGAVESSASNTVTVMVNADDYATSAYDDGTAETGISLPSSQQMAVMHSTFANQSVSLKYAAIYVHQLATSTMIVRVYEVDNVNNRPGAMVVQSTYPTVNIVPGWNYIPIQDNVVFPNGKFCLGLLIPPNSHVIGLDTNSSGHSYTTTSSSWTPYLGGEIMIRAIVELSGPAPGTQSIPLASGWNLSSLNVSPANHSLPAILGSISGSVLQIKGTDGVYIPGNPYSSLTALSDGKAYSIQMSSTATWNVSGTQIPANTAIALVDGWNLAAYLPQTAMSVGPAMQSISTWLQQVKGADGVYIPGNPYSSLSTLYPGKGYWVKIYGAHQLVYPSRSEVAELSGKSQRSATKLPEVKLLPQSMTLLARCDGANAGDVLLAKIGGELRGAVELIDLEGFPAALMQIYCDDAAQEISLWVMKPDGSLLPVAGTIQSLPNTSLGTYPEFILLEAFAEGDESPALQNALLGCYPNPFNPSTTISFNIAIDDTPVSLSIYNMRGQRVARIAEAKYPAGNHKLVWNGTDHNHRSQGSGVYIIELKAGSYRKTAKAVLTK